MVVAMFFWGAGWSVAKVATQEASVEILAFYRYLFSMISFAFVFFVYKKKLWVKRGFMTLVLLGILGTTAFNIFFFKAVEFGDSGAGGALVTTLAPILTFVYTVVIMRTKVSALKYFALTLGAIGGFLMLGIWDFQDGFIMQKSNIYFLFAAFSWALVTVVASKAKEKIDAVYYTFFVFLGVSIISYIVAFDQSPFEIANYGVKFWFGVLFLGVLAGGFGTGIFFMASAKLGAAKAGVFMFMVPASAMFTSFVFLGEVPQPILFVGAVLALCAIYLYNFSKKFEPLSSKLDT